MNQEINDPDDPKMDDANRVAYLIAGYIRHALTDEERDELDEWVTASDDNMRQFAKMTDEKNIEKGLKERNIYEADKAVQRFKRKLNKKRNVRLLYYGVAASILLVVGILFLAPLLQKNKPSKIITEKPDLQPGGDRATLTLSNGKKVILDTAHGNIFQEGNLSVINHDGKIIYEGAAGEIEYHTLTTPKGGQYKIILPDGTAVWLNAASSLKYPVAFTGAERKVELTGEAYFEVVKDTTKKFIVNSNNKGEVEVLGTHFNVNAYDDEPATKITLLEGSIKITCHPRRSEGPDSRIIKPGEQLTISLTGQLSTTTDIDLDEITAWKNGTFEFKDEPIESVMRQVARWYDVTVKYEGKISNHFNASIPRNVPVSKLFHLLELNDNVHFTIQDKTIIVKP